MKWRDFWLPSFVTSKFLETVSFMLPTPNNIALNTIPIFPIYTPSIFCPKDFKDKQNKIYHFVT